MWDIIFQRRESKYEIAQPQISSTSLGDEKKINIQVSHSPAP